MEIGQIPPVSESAEQQALFRWANFASAKYPVLELMYHIPNEGKRTAYTGGKLKREGLKKGVPDICLPVPNNTYHGLYIEMKVGKNKPTKEQNNYIQSLNKLGYLAVVCYGWEQARAVIERYLKGMTKK